MLVLYEQEEALQERQEGLRRALLSAGAPLDIVFPELASEKSTAEEIEDAFESDGAVEWVSAPPEEAYQVIERLNLMTGGGTLESDDIFARS